MSLHISLCTLKEEIKKIKLEFVTKDKSNETVVSRIVAITSAEEDEFTRPVLEYAAKFTIVVNRKPWLSRCPSCSAAPGTSSLSSW